MFECLYCGYSSQNDRARFCIECGPEGPSIDWRLEDVDRLEQLAQYEIILEEYYFDPATRTESEIFAQRARKRLKISHKAHQKISKELHDEKALIKHLFNFRIEFDENVKDAYAGHDTFLNFQFFNLSLDERFNVGLVWDDPETLNRNDFIAHSFSHVKPLASVTIGGKVIFERQGIKEIRDLLITVKDPFGAHAIFRSDPFTFNVRNHNQSIVQNISTHNQITVEGRAVFDAAGIGAVSAESLSQPSAIPSWRMLNFRYVTQKQLAREYSNKELAGDCFKNLKNILSSSSNEDSLNSSLSHGNNFFPEISIYIKGKSSLKSVCNQNDLNDILEINNINAKSNWHVLISGHKNISKILIRDLILQNKNFKKTTHIIPSNIKDKDDLGTYLYSLKELSLLEFEGLDEFLSAHGSLEDFLCGSLLDFQLKQIVGEGEKERYSVLDLVPFSSIFYCQDVSVLSLNVLKCFNLCIALT